MRVGIVTEYYRPWPGGISEHVHHQAVELTERGHDVTVFTGPSVPGWTDDGPFEVERLPWAHEFTHNGARSRMVLSGALLGFRKRFRHHALDVVHVHCTHGSFSGLGRLAGQRVCHRRHFSRELRSVGTLGWTLQAATDDHGSCL
ncbi:MAG: glycosyltransferase [Myxococcota bacterium]